MWYVCVSSFRSFVYLFILIFFRVSYSIGFVSLHGDFISRRRTICFSGVFEIREILFVAMSLFSRLKCIHARAAHTVERKKKVRKKFVENHTHTTAHRTHTVRMILECALRSVRVRQANWNTTVRFGLAVVFWLRKEIFLISFHPSTTTMTATATATEAAATTTKQKRQQTTTTTIQWTEKTGRNTVHSLTTTNVSVCAASDLLALLTLYSCSIVEVVLIIIVFFISFHALNQVLAVHTHIAAQTHEQKQKTY